MSVTTVHDECLVDARGVRVTYPAVRSVAQGKRSTKTAPTTAVRDVDLTIRAGQTLGVLGESGCGKTSLGRALLRLVPLVAGAVRIEGVNVGALTGRSLRQFRPRMQMVFQSAAQSLNPRMRAAQIVADPLAAQGIARGKLARDQARTMLARVGLDSILHDRFPHELSGGQRQRVGIARALILRPSFVVCDEPVSALDATARAQLLDLLRVVQAEQGLAYLFVTHDFSVARRMCHTVAVMYAGRFVETGPADAVLAGGRHPYTQALRAAVPSADPARRGQLTVLPGEPPTATTDPGGCAFHPRCPRATAHCRQVRPVLETKAGMPEGWQVACHDPVNPADAAGRHEVSGPPHGTSEQP